MKPTSPENQRTVIRAMSLLLILLASVAALGASLGVGGASRAEAMATSVEVALPTEAQPVPTFDPFTQHDRLPTGLSWVVQVERPAEQLESEQGRSLAAAIDQTDLNTQTRKAWARLSRTLGGEKEAYALLGRRAMFVAGPSSTGSPWAVCVEIAPDQRAGLIARLNAFPRLSRNTRPISELEDGRYLLAVFDQGTRAVVLLGPRSDRTVSPEADTKTGLFFDLFDRLSGEPMPAAAPGSLAAALEAVGPGEVLIARQGTDLLWGTPGQAVTFPGEGEAATRDGEPGFMALRMDRTAGGWTGKAVLSDDAADEAEPVKSGRLNYAGLERSAPTVSWLTISPRVNEVVSLITLRLLSVAVSLPEDANATSYVALLDPDPATPDSKPALAIVTRVGAEDGPASMDHAMAEALGGVSKGGPDHGGKYPAAVRVQRFATPSPLGPEAEAAWGYSKNVKGERMTALVFTHATGENERESDASTLVAGLLRATLNDEPARANGGSGEVEPVAAGHLRPAALQRLMRRLVPTDQPQEPLLTRVDSVTWSLRRVEVGGRTAAAGPVSLKLTPSRPGELGTD